MLVLSRKVNETIVIGGNVRVTVTAVRGKHVRVAIEAPRDVPVYREELLQGPGASSGAGTSAERGREAEPARRTAGLVKRVARGTDPIVPQGVPSL